MVHSTGYGLPLLSRMRGLFSFQSVAHLPSPFLRIHFVTSLCWLRSSCKLVVTFTISWQSSRCPLSHRVLSPGSSTVAHLPLSLSLSVYICWQRKNGLMDHEDFRACLISMGYDLVRQSGNFTKVGYSIELGFFTGGGCHKGQLAHLGLVRCH